jgi:transcriptional regulator with XRE-family HTH domain
LQPIDAERVKEWRHRRMLSQQEVADRAGTSLFTIQRIERGEGNVRPKTGRGVAAALGVPIQELLPKAQAPPSPTQPPLNGFEEERRTQHLGVLKSYLSRRVEWCERVLQKSPEDSFNNPFLALNTAIQWAIYVGSEGAQLRNALRTEIRPHADADSEIVGELRALLDRFIAVGDTTDVRVKAMMDEAGLADEEKEQRLRVIDGGAA